jgi:hypothetical protein
MLWSERVFDAAISELDGISGVLSWFNVPSTVEFPGARYYASIAGKAGGEIR